MEKVKWYCKHFNDLSAKEFHQITYLRTEVFVVEQNCPYQEIDAKDLVSNHVFGLNENNQVIAVSRIVPKNISYQEISIGRVCTDKNYRGSGLAQQLMQKSFDFIDELFGKQSIRISAQQYLTNFYNKQGFVQVSEMYLEDDIPHVEMLKKV